jgi:hypothetical protein
MPSDLAAKNPHHIDSPTDRTQADVTDIVGFIHAIDGSGVHGWAIDRNHPDDKLDVEIFLDNEPVQVVRADVFRDHLKQAGIGNGAHGFTVELPIQLSKDEHHRVSATVSKPGDGGITRLKNHAAGNANAHAPSLSGFTELGRQLEQCVDDQRAGFRWIYRELQELDQCIRKLSQTRPVAADNETAAKSAFDNQIAQMAQNQNVIHESLVEMTTLQNSLNKRLEQFEIFNARIDERLENLQLTQEPGPITKDDQRGLKRLILLLGCLTISSLALGLIALLR